MTREEAEEIVKEKISGLEKASYNLMEVDGVFVANISFVPTKPVINLTKSEWDQWWSLSEKIFNDSR